MALFDCMNCDNEDPHFDCDNGELEPVKRQPKVKEGLPNMDYFDD